jgi:hypothetical protein
VATSAAPCSTLVAAAQRPLGERAERPRNKPPVELAGMATEEQQQDQDQETVTVWEGQRWWVGLSFRAESPRFVADGEQDKVWRPLTSSRALEAVKDLADKVAGDGAAADAAAIAEAAALSASFLESSGGGGDRGWEWVTDHRWTVVRDATCDEEGWTYASDWPRITAPRAGGRKSQRAKDMVRRRRIVRTRRLAERTTTPCAGDEGGLLEAIVALEETRAAELEQEKNQRAEVLKTVSELTQAHISGRSLMEKQAAISPTAWYNLSNTHAEEAEVLLATRPAVDLSAGGADLATLRDLIRGMRFANGAYGLAADKMVSMTSNIKLHGAALAGVVDCKSKSCTHPRATASAWLGSARFLSLHLILLDDARLLVPHHALTGGAFPFAVLFLRTVCPL